MHFTICIIIMVNKANVVEIIASWCSAILHHITLSCWYPTFPNHKFAYSVYRTALKPYLELKYLNFCSWKIQAAFNSQPRFKSGPRKPYIRPEIDISFTWVSRETERGCLWIMFTLFLCKTICPLPWFEPVWASQTAIYQLYQSVSFIRLAT